MEGVLTTAIGYLVPFAEACGALVIVIGVLRAIVLHVIGVFRRGLPQTTALRIGLGQSMVMGIEFQVAADILKTALSPTWSDLLQLAALIALRTVLNYLLERELMALDSPRRVSTPDE
jgi:uncharacterized membrane protein